MRPRGLVKSRRSVALSYKGGRQRIWTSQRRTRLDCYWVRGICLGYSVRLRNFRTTPLKRQSVEVCHTCISHYLTTISRLLRTGKARDWQRLWSESCPQNLWEVQAAWQVKDEERLQRDQDLVTDRPSEHHQVTARHRQLVTNCPGHGVHWPEDNVSLPQGQAWEKGLWRRGQDNLQVDRKRSSVPALEEHRSSWY